MKQPERVVEPVLTPPLPPEPLASLGAHQVPPNLPLHPLADKRKALARVACREVVHPTGPLVSRKPTSGVNVAGPDSESHVYNNLAPFVGLNDLCNLSRFCDA
jgi:hypothetical protein